MTAALGTLCGTDRKQKDFRLVYFSQYQVPALNPHRQSYRRGQPVGMSG